MTPARFALGMSLAVTAGLHFVWRFELDYLHRYWALIAARDGPWLLAAAATFFAALYAALYTLGRHLGFGDLGRRVQHAEREMLAGRGHDRELGERLRRDREGRF